MGFWQGIWGVAGRLLLVLLLGSGCTAKAAHLTYGWQSVDGINVFYREGGPADAPTLVLLHGNPASSILYQELMERLAESGNLHVLAMDYPSFGYSDAPDHTSYRYTFDNVASTVKKFLAARGVTRYGLYMQDYGVPIGFRLLTENLAAITAVIVQNGVIHLDGFPVAQDPGGELRQHWLKRNAAVDKRRAEYARALAYPSAANWSEDERLSPDAVLLMSASEQRPGVIDARNDLWFDYGSNVLSYPANRSMSASCPCFFRKRRWRPLIVKQSLNSSNPDSVAGLNRATACRSAFAEWVPGILIASPVESERVSRS